MRETLEKEEETQIWDKMYDECDEEEEKEEIMEVKNMNNAN